jgi:hypothetical protein
MVECMSAEIGDEKTRAAFVKKFAGGDSASKLVSQSASAPKEATISQKFTAETLQKAATALAQYLGAIAKVVVKHAAAKARDEAALYLLIADEIKDPPSARPLCARRFRFQGEVDREEGSCQNSSTGISNRKRTGSPSCSNTDQPTQLFGRGAVQELAGRQALRIGLAYRPDEALQDRDHVFPRRAFVKDFPDPGAVARAADLNDIVVLAVTVDADLGGGRTRARIGTARHAEDHVNLAQAGFL